MASPADLAAEVAEWAARADFPTFAKALLRIENEKGQLVPFELNEAQWIVYREIERQRAMGRPVRILILKGRQQGMSTLIQAYMCWHAFTLEGFRGLTVGHKLSAVSELFGKAETMYDGLPDFLKPSRTGDRGKRLKLDAPSRSLLVAESAERPDAAGRSGTFMGLHLTETPMWADPERTMAAVLACVPPDPETFIVVESTAKGMGNWFHSEYVKGEEMLHKGQEPGFVPVFVPWYVTQRYQRKPYNGEPKLDATEREFKRRYKLTDEQCYWYRDQRESNAERALQEYPSNPNEAFLSSGLPFFKRRSLESYERMVKERQPLKRGRFQVFKRGGASHASLVEEDNGEQAQTWLWELPVPGHRYSIGIDPSSGRAHDNTTMQVVDVDEFRQVASHMSKLAPDEVAVEAVYLASVFNSALLVPERTGIVEALVSRLAVDIGYSNIYRHVDEATLGSSLSNQLGFPTSTKTRAPLLEDLAAVVHTEELKVYCPRTLREMRTFVYSDDKGQKAEANAGARDDLVLALALAVKGVESYPADTSGFDEYWEELDSDGPLIARSTGY